MRNFRERSVAIIRREMKKKKRKEREETNKEKAEIERDPSTKTNK